jgi:hypothetical protein
MDTRHVYIDSRSRSNGTPANATFLLNRTLHDVSSVQVRSFMFANTIFNIDEFNNQLILSDGQNNQFIFTLTTGFYTPQNFVAELNAILGPRVSLRNDKLVWSLVNGLSLTGGTISDVIGRYQRLSGNFETQLTLSSPAAIAVRCKQIQSSTEHITTHKNPIGTTPLLISNLVRGYGNLEVYEPQTMYVENFAMRATDTLSFDLVDPRTGRLLTEINAWSMILRITST